MDLAARRWRVIPLHAPIDHGCSCRRPRCESVGKHPIERRWTATASTNVQTIREWWSAHPRANVGLVTGRGSGVVVLDVDPRHGGDDTLYDLERAHSPLPATVEVVTGGGGRGLIFKAPETPIPTTAGALGPGLDTRGEGGLAVMPPSLHTSGRRYEWSVDGHPDDVPLADMPAWLIALLAHRTAKLKQKYDGGDITEGRRRDVLLSLAGSMRRLGLDHQSIGSALLAHNAKRCKPPLETDEIERIVQSVATWPTGPPWLRDRLSLLDYIAGSEASSRELDRLRERQVLLVLASHADDKGTCWPGYARIERLSGVAQRHIRATLDRLEDFGHVEAIRKGRGAVNHYRVIAR